MTVPRRLVIMPAWNEECSIGATIQELRHCHPTMDLLVVNDGSTDATAAIASSMGASVISLPVNLGVGAALRTGFKYAWRAGYDQVIQMDADGQHDPAEIATLLEALEHCDIVVGSRFAGSGNYRVRGPRKWAMRLLAAIFTRMAGTPLNDVTSGFKASNRRALGGYVVWFPTEYLGDTINALMTALRVGLKVQQVPVHMKPRRGGVPSHSPLKSVLYLGRSLMAALISATRRVPAGEMVGKDNT